MTPLPPMHTTLSCSLRVFSVKYSPTIGPTASGDRAARATSGARRTPLSARNKRVPSRQDRPHAGPTAAWDGITGRAPHGKRWGRSPEANTLGRFKRSRRIGHNKRGARNPRDRPAYNEKGPAYNERGSLTTGTSLGAFGRAMAFSHCRLRRSDAPTVIAPFAPLPLRIGWLQP